MGCGKRKGQGERAFLALLHRYGWRCVVVMAQWSCNKTTRSLLPADSGWPRKRRIRGERGKARSPWLVSEWLWNRRTRGPRNLFSSFRPVVGGGRCDEVVPGVTDGGEGLQDEADVAAAVGGVDEGLECGCEDLR